MELFSINFTISVRICHADELAELLFAERNIEHGEYHFKLHMREYSITVAIKPRKSLSNIDALLLELALKLISKLLKLIKFTICMLFSFFDDISVMDHLCAC